VCFVLLLYRVHPVYPIVIAANREERRNRPATPPHEWEGEPRLWAGRDGEAGGTWLGVNEHGLLVGITNRRSDANDPKAPSRGGLCLSALRQPDAAAARALFEKELADRRFNPFNLVVADLDQAWVGTWRGDVHPLDSGSHVIVSRGDVDDPSFPRVRRGHRLVSSINPSELELVPLLHHLAQICTSRTRPDPICRPGGKRGTVSSSLIAVDRAGQLAAYWHADGPPTSVDRYQAIAVPGPESHEPSPLVVASS
jgi:hypothetical protein